MVLDSSGSIDEARRLVGSVPHWHHSFEIAPGVRTPGTYDPWSMMIWLDIAERCRGKRVLDIGASDGFFSKVIKSYGAEVVAVDYRAKEQHGFGVMEQLSGETFDYRQMNVYDLSPDTMGGQFDIVLFLGVLYHLPDMLRALCTVRGMCREGGSMFLETWIDASGGDRPLASYAKANSANGDWTNFWAPNRACVHDMLYDASFDVARDRDAGEAGRLVLEAKAVFRGETAWKMKMAYGRPE